MKSEDKREGNKEDLFSRLPVELLLSILNRLGDLKYLCWCSLVSKHFAKVIFQIRTVSLIISSSGAPSEKSFETMLTLLMKLHSSGVEQIPAILESPSLKKLKMPIFLERFRELESIHMEYMHPENGPNFSFPKWKVKINDTSAKIESFVSLLPLRVHLKEKDEPDQERVSQLSSFDLMKIPVRQTFWLSYGRYVEWLCLICVMAKTHSSLRLVTIADSEKQSKLVMREKQLVKVRNNVGELLLEEPWTTKYVVKFARVPLLSLPLSGYVVERAHLLTINIDPAESCMKAKNVDDLDSKDDDEVLAEAITEILKNHGDEILQARFLNH